MSDASMEVIKKGTKLPLRPNNDNSNNNGTILETRSQDGGIIYKTFSCQGNDDKKNK